MVMQFRCTVEKVEKATLPSPGASSYDRELHTRDNNVDDDDDASYARVLAQRVGTLDDPFDHRDRSALLGPFDEGANAEYKSLANNMSAVSDDDDDDGDDGNNCINGDANKVQEEEGGNKGEGEESDAAAGGGSEAKGEPWDEVAAVERRRSNRSTNDGTGSKADGKVGVAVADERSVFADAADGAIALGPPGPNDRDGGRPSSRASNRSGGRPSSRNGRPPVDRVPSKSGLSVADNANETGGRPSSRASNKSSGRPSSRTGMLPPIDRVPSKKNILAAKDVDDNASVITERSAGAKSESARSVKSSRSTKSARSTKSSKSIKSGRSIIGSSKPEASLSRTNSDGACDQGCRKICGDGGAVLAAESESESNKAQDLVVADPLSEPWGPTLSCESGVLQKTIDAIKKEGEEDVTNTAIVRKSLERTEEVQVSRIRSDMATAKSKSKAKAKAKEATEGVDAAEEPDDGAMTPEDSSTDAKARDGAVESPAPPPKSPSRIGRDKQRDATAAATPSSEESKARPSRASPLRRRRPRASPSPMGRKAAVFARLKSKRLFGGKKKPAAAGDEASTLASRVPGEVVEEEVMKEEVAKEEGGIDKTGEDAADIIAEVLPAESDNGAARESEAKEDSTSDEDSPVPVSTPAVPTNKVTAAKASPDDEDSSEVPSLTPTPAPTKDTAPTATFPEQATDSIDDGTGPKGLSITSTRDVTKVADLARVGSTRSSRTADTENVTVESGGSRTGKKENEGATKEGEGVSSALVLLKDETLIDDSGERAIVPMSSSVKEGKDDEGRAPGGAVGSLFERLFTCTGGAAPLRCNGGTAPLRCNGGTAPLRCNGGTAPLRCNGATAPLQCNGMDKLVDELADELADVVVAESTDSFYCSDYEEEEEEEEKSHIVLFEDGVDESLDIEIFQDANNRTRILGPTDSAEEVMRALSSQAQSSRRQSRSRVTSKDIYKTKVKPGFEVLSSEGNKADEVVDTVTVKIDEIACKLENKRGKNRRKKLFAKYRGKKKGESVKKNDEKKSENGNNGMEKSAPASSGRKKERRRLRSRSKSKSRTKRGGRLDVQ